MSMRNSEIKEGDLIKSIEKCFLVLHSFSNEKTSLTISDAAKITNLSKPSVRRILLTLTYLGYLKQTEQNTFHLTPKILSLASIYTNSNTMWEAVTPFIKELSEEINESTSISVLNEDQIIYVARIGVNKIINVSLNIGSRLPAHATSMGQTILAYSSEQQQEHFFQLSKLEKITENTCISKEELQKKFKKITKDGYNISNEELEIGLTSISAPIFDYYDRVIAAINISLQTSKFQSSNDIHKEFIQPLLNCSNTISNFFRHNSITSLY